MYKLLRIYTFCFNKWAITNSVVDIDKSTHTAWQMSMCCISTAMPNKNFICVVKGETDKEIQMK